MSAEQLFRGVALVMSAAAGGFIMGSGFMIAVGASPHRERMTATAWAMIGAAWGACFAAWVLS